MKAFFKLIAGCMINTFLPYIYTHNHIYTYIYIANILIVLSGKDLLPKDEAGNWKVK